MISDPLARRTRAVVFGVVALLLLGAGAGFMAFLRPAVDPGQAAILRSDSGALFVRVDGVAHPVTNLASARLIAAEPLEPARISDAILVREPIGTRLGIPRAPEVIAAAPPAELQWAACQQTAPPGQITVLAQETLPQIQLAAGEGIVARTAQRDYLVTAEGRREIPSAFTPQGRALRRRLDIGEHTPVWHAAPEVVRLIPELPPLLIPAHGEVLHAGDEAWWRTHDGVTRLSPLQADMLADVGLPHHNVHPEEISALADASQVSLTLPRETPRWRAGEHVCVDAAGRAGAVAEVGGGMPLAGNAIAHRFHAPGVGAVVVDTGEGHRVVGEEGTVFPVPDPAALGALGLGEAHVFPAPWGILRLLPGGPELTREAALHSA